MGIIDGLLGNASNMDAGKAQKEYAKLLGNGETVEQAYRFIRDTIVFTNRRMIIIDVQGMTGKKVSYHSVPYKSIRHFAVESIGHFDMEAELKIWVSGMGNEPITEPFGKDQDVYKVQALLAEYVSR